MVNKWEGVQRFSHRGARERNGIELADGRGNRFRATEPESFTLLRLELAWSKARCHRCSTVRQVTVSTTPTASVPRLRLRLEAMNPAVTLTCTRVLSMEDCGVSLQGLVHVMFQIAPTTRSSNAAPMVSGSQPMQGTRIAARSRHNNYVDPCVEPPSPNFLLSFMSRRDLIRSDHEPGFVVVFRF